MSRAGSRSRLPALLATVVAPVVAYFVIRSAALALSGPIALAAGSTLYPKDYSAVSGAMLRLTQQPGRAVGFDELQFARLTAARMPLAFEPFFIAAKVAERAGDLDKALTLMEEAKRRRPNYTATRTQLLLYYGRKLDYPAFLREIDYVIRRNETVGARLIPEMVKTIRQPAGRNALATLLAKNPSWREAFFSAAGEAKIDPRDAAALLSDIRAQKKGGDFALEERFYVSTLVKAQNYGTAYREWSRSAKPGVEDGNLVVDGSFRGVNAPPPFGWQLKDLDVGRATMSGDRTAPQLDVEYFGGKTALLAEQLLAAGAGRYRLAMVVRSDAPPDPGTISWRLQCLPGGSEIGRLVLDRLSSGPRPLSVDLTIPAQCAGQTLQLVAEPADVARPVNLAISNMSLRRVQ